MAYPTGVSLAVIEAGQAFTAFGGDVTMTAKVTPVFLATDGSTMQRIVHTATGHPMLATTDTFVAEPGFVLSFSVPHVDQAGWQSPSGAAYTRWYYKVEVTATIGGGRSSTKHMWHQNVQPLVGQDFIDLDLIADGPTGDPVTAPQAAVTSVEGATGAVSLTVTESEPGVYVVSAA